MTTINKPDSKKAVYTVALIVLAVGSYYLTLWATPYYVQYKFASRQKNIPNTIHFSPKPSAQNLRVVPLPNPDFLYSTIGYNISDSILEISGPVPDSTYWSLATYQANSTNFFVVNNGKVNKQFEFYLVKEGTHSAFIDALPKDKIIITPTSRGLVLFRYLISKAYPIDSLISLQHTVQVTAIKI
jgi:uncharacterized membrane protein